MDQSTRKKAIVVAGLVALASIIGEGKMLIHQHKIIGQLGQEIEIARQTIETTRLVRDNYRKELIKYGNPEGWKTDFDEMTGEVYFTRSAGDAIGNYWTEYLK